MKARCRTGQRGMALRPQTNASKMCASVTLPVLLLLVPAGPRSGGSAHAVAVAAAVAILAVLAQVWASKVFAARGERGIEGLGGFAPAVGLGHALAAQVRMRSMRSGVVKCAISSRWLRMGCIRGCMAWVKVVHAASCAGPASAGP